MSDFIYTSSSTDAGMLATVLTSIYLTDPPVTQTFQGDWGALAVTNSRYRGFQPVDEDKYLCVIIGGPVLCFRNNSFLVGNDSPDGTKAIMMRWLDGKMNWSEDLSGPFAALLINKRDKIITWVTDLMLFIPVYQYGQGKRFAVGTHVDSLAQATKQRGNWDEASIADFIIHDVVTYPYTFYTKIRQCRPASLYIYHKGVDTSFDSLPAPYWVPEENNAYPGIDEAAESLRSGIKGYIDRVTDQMDHVAQFLSAGEDSRAVAGMLPEHIRRDAFIFLDRMNREGRIAEKVAKTYGVRFVPDFRTKTHYLDIMPEASRLVGSGHQYIHAHSLVFNRKHHLDRYTAVFGGYLADSLLKAQYALKSTMIKGYGFLPQRLTEGEMRSQRVSHPMFADELLDVITSRRMNHLKEIIKIRPVSAHEWFVLWPMTMRTTMPYFHSTRRLFSSYEPFMSSESVRCSASVKTEWKLNRALFNRAFRPALKKSCLIRHADGRYPYLPWWASFPFQVSTLALRSIQRKFVSNKVNEGPWSDLREVSLMIDSCDKSPKMLVDAEYWINFSPKSCSFLQKLNILQSCEILKKYKDE